MNTLARLSRWRVLAGVVLAALAAGAALAQSEARTERIQFKKGASSATVIGRIKGYQTVDYLVAARRGQNANISLGTKHGATYFNLLAPGKKDEAFFIGSVSQNQYEGVLPTDGTYRIRVYMMRSAARRNEVADYRLEVVIAGAPAAAATRAPVPSVDAKVPGTGFHAIGPLPCSIGGAPVDVQCKFGVQRQGQGSGLVEITKPDGSKRTVFFDKGRATGYDASQVDKAEFKATRQGDSTSVQIGSERYEIPDAVIFGG